MGLHAFAADLKMPGRSDSYAGQLVEANPGAAKRHPEQGYRSCLGILRLAKIYPGRAYGSWQPRRCLSASLALTTARVWTRFPEEPIQDRLPPPGDPLDSKYCEPREHPAALDYFPISPRRKPSLR